MPNYPYFSQICFCFFPCDFCNFSRNLLTSKLNMERIDALVHAVITIWHYATNSDGSQWDIAGFEGIRSCLNFLVLSKTLNLCLPYRQMVHTVNNPAEFVSGGMRYVTLEATESQATTSRLTPHQENVERMCCFRNRTFIKQQTRLCQQRGCQHSHRGIILYYNYRC